MKISFQGNNNAKAVSDFEALTGYTAVNAEVFEGKSNGHKFRPGQKCKLFGLEDYPEFDEETITITSIREDGPRGKAYYFKTDNSIIATQLNWTYEYRLKEI